MRAAIDWGGVPQGEWLDLPADLAHKLRGYRNVYDAFRSYRNAGAQNATVPWTKQNPDAWDLVSKIISVRKMRKRG